METQQLWISRGNDEVRELFRELLDVSERLENCRKLNSGFESELGSIIESVDQLTGAILDKEMKHRS